MEPNSNNAANANQQNAAANQPAAGSEPQKNDTSGIQGFDDYLKAGGQSEFDKRVSKALETARAKWDADAKAQAAEAEKLAKMNAEEKAKHEREKAEQKLREREAEITRRELKASAKEILAEKKLPLSLAELPLDYTDADKCKASLDTLEKAFNEAVTAAVDDRMKGSAPKMGQAQGMSDDNAIINAIMGLPADTK